MKTHHHALSPIAPVCKYRLAGLLLTLAAGTVYAAAPATLRMQPIASSASNALPENGITLYGGPGNDILRNTSCDSQGACWLFGYTNKSFGDSTDFLVIRLKPSGQPDWAKTYGGTNLDELRTGFPTNDGGALLVGMSQSLFYTSLKIFSPSKPPRPLLVRIDKNGNPVWATTVDLGYGDSYPTLQFERGIQLSDGGFALVGGYIVGPTNAATKSDPEHFWSWNGVIPDFSSKGYETMAVMRISPDGQVLWAKRYSPDADVTAAWDIEPLADGNFRLLANDGTRTNLLWVTLDKDGQVVGARLMDQPKVGAPITMVPTPNGGEIVLGDSKNVVPATEKPNALTPGGLLIAKFDPDGSAAWIHSYTYSLPLTPTAATWVSANDLCVAGRLNGGNQSRGIAIRINANGQLLGAELFGQNAATELFAASALPANRCLLGGTTLDYGAKFADIMTSVWNLGGTTQANGFYSAEFKADFQVVKLLTATGDIKGLHTLPVSLLKVVPIPLPTANN